MNTTPSNRLSPMHFASFDVTQKDADRAKAAGVPGLMHCAKCGLDHLDPAIAGEGLTMEPTSEGWVCAPGYGCREDVCSQCGLSIEKCAAKATSR